jgi:hypothetical protein
MSLKLAAPRTVTTACAGILLLTSAAIGHHGWAWTEEETFELTGTIEDIYLGNPHAALKVKAAEGTWDVDLAPPARTRRAGFDESAAELGDAVTAIGNRSRDHSQLWMKAVTIEVNGKRFDVYPDRVKRS